MDKRFITIIFLLLSIFAFGQNPTQDIKPANEIYIKNVTKYRKLWWVVKFAPFTVFDYRHPSIQLGLERRVYENLAMQVEYGYILPKEYTTDYQYYPPDFKGYRLRGELKYYLPVNDKRNKYGPYCSIEGYQTKNNFKVRLNMESRIDSLNIIYYHDDLKIFKNLKGINLKFGYQRNFGRFVLDTYVGVGVQHKIADVFGRTNLDDETNLYFESADFNEIMILEEKSENRYVPKFTMNIKVGYLLW